MDNKYFSVEEMNSLIENLELAFTDYGDKADTLISKCKEFQNDDSYTGERATVVKDLVGDNEVSLVNAQKDMQAKLLSMYKHAADSFAEKVDSAPNARLDLETLDMVESDLKAIYRDVDITCAEIENIAKEMNAKYGHFGHITVPNADPLRESLENLCGGYNPEAGFYHDLKQKFINWDEEECAYIESQLFEDTITETNNNIVQLGSQLDNIISQGYKTQFLSTAKPKIKLDNDDIFKIVQERYNYSDEEMAFLKQNYEDFLLALYGASCYSSSDADVIYDKLEIYLDVGLRGIKYGNYEFSIDAIDLLKNLEQGDWGTSRYGVYRNGELVGYWPHYVGDKGITLGYGHYIDKDEFNNDLSERNLLLRYVHQDNIVFNSKPGIVGNSDYVSLYEMDILLYKDINYSLKIIVDWCEENNISITQNELEALVIYRFNKGHLTDECLELLEANNRNESDWSAIWTGSTDRINECQNLFFNK